MKNTKSSLLVALQLLSLFYIFWTGDIIPNDPMTIAVLLLGAFLSLWAFYALRTTKFSILPEVPENSALVTAGPYKIIRHPMYTGIMLIAAALVTYDFSFDRVLALLLLFGVLLYKTELEEKYLDKHFKEYGSYKSQTKKLVPYLY